MLEKTTHIEGLVDDFHDVELLDDTSPYKVLTKFHVVSEEMPFLSAQEGRVIRKNFVYITHTWELGRTSISERIKDTVVFDEGTKKWKITMLAPGEQSDIRRFPEAWNSFARNASEDDLGTPLMLLFKNDPSRVEHYKAYHITTVERLAGMNPSDLENMGMGARGDSERARSYLARAQGNADKTAATYQIDMVVQENQSLRSQVEDLSSKLSQLLEAQLGESPKRRGRPAKTEIEATES